jgi:hypothetical protein
LPNRPVASAAGGVAGVAGVAGAAGAAGPSAARGGAGRADEGRRGGGDDAARPARGAGGAARAGADEARFSEAGMARYQSVRWRSVLVAEIKLEHPARLRADSGLAFALANF